jgi:hypothetical protein
MNNIFQKVNEMLRKEDVANVLNYFGIEAKINGNFRLRDDDTVPSAGIFIHKSGIPMVKDFGGGGFVGDVFKTLKEFRGISYKDSVKFLKNYLGLSEMDKEEVKRISNYVRITNVELKNKETLTEEEIEKRWLKLYPLNTLGDKKMKEAVSKLVPYEYFINATDEYKNRFLERVKYSSYADDVAVKALKPDGKMLAYKYRRWKTPEGETIKWKALKGTPANKYAQFYINNPLEPVFIVEGYHDYINAVLTGINFIAVPTKHYSFKEDELILLKNRKFDFVLIQDYDFDEKDKIKEMKKREDSLAQENKIKSFLVPYTKTFTTWRNIRNVFKKEVKEINKLKDFSDIISLSHCKSPSEIKKILFEKAENKNKLEKNFSFKKKGIVSFG